MCKINIYRHFKVKADFPNWVAANDLGYAIDHYNDAPIELPDVANPEKPHSFVVCSSLRRSKETAQHLFGQFDLSDPIFREAELPYPPLGLLKLSVGLWFVIARIFWILSYHGDVESRRAFQTRVRQAAEVLVNLSLEHQTITFIGHGIFNRMVCGELRRLGFTGPQRPSSKYGGWITLTHQAK